MIDPDRPAVDESRSADLDNGWSAGWLVYGSGDEWPWLLSPDDDRAAADAYPAHELVGPLPAAILERVQRRPAPARPPDQDTCPR